MLLGFCLYGKPKIFDVKFSNFDIAMYPFILYLKL